MKLLFCLNFLFLFHPSFSQCSCEQGDQIFIKNPNFEDGMPLAVPNSTGAADWISIATPDLTNSNLTIHCVNVQADESCNQGNFLRIVSFEGIYQNIECLVQGENYYVGLSYALQKVSGRSSGWLDVTLGNTTLMTPIIDAAEIENYEQTPWQYVEIGPFIVNSSAAELRINARSSMDGLCDNGGSGDCIDEEFLCDQIYPGAPTCDLVLDGISLCGPSNNCGNAPWVQRTCDDNNECTINDFEYIIECNEQICQPCLGTLLVCDEGPFLVIPCNDLDNATVNDVEILLACDESVCEPCSGIPENCISMDTIRVVCDDFNPCTILDQELIVTATGEICEPCNGIKQDCQEGETYELPCDDGQDFTFNDVEIYLECDQSLCQLCLGEKQDLLIYIPNVFSPESMFNNEFKISSNFPFEIESLKIFDRWGNLLYEISNLLNTNQSAYWNGMLGNKYVTPGVYVYKLSYRYEEEILFEAGTITVIR